VRAGLSLPLTARIAAGPRLSLPRGLAAGLILAATAWHVLYLLNDCPLELAADEAHYWDWSRRLDWSYYSKGPLVAWLIRASRELLGGLSERLVGSEMLAVRLPAVLFSAGLLTAIFILTTRVLKSEWLGAAAVAAALSLPVIAAGGTVMTIDAPYVCCWAWALVWGHAALFRRARWAWPAAGLAVGIGILAKYTMVLWLPCVALFLAATPGFRRQLLGRGLWTAVLIAAACSVPILIWNVQNDWITLRHVGTQAAGNGSGWRWAGPLRFVGEQAGLLMVFWFLAWAAALVRHSPLREANPERLYLWWLSAPVFGLFFVVSLRTTGQVNWAVTAYVAGLVLAVGWIADRWQTSPWMRRSAITAAVIGFALTALSHYPQVLRPALVALSGEPTVQQPFPLRRLDPTVRLRGWRHLAAAVDDVRRQVTADGEEPVVAASFWTLPGQLAFYGRGQPDVYCLGAALAQRMSQYDLWRPNPAWDPERFRGRTFIFVGDVAPRLIEAFERVEAPRYVQYSEEGRPVAYWYVTICRGYRGFGPPQTWPGGQRY